MAQEQTVVFNTGFPRNGMVYFQPLFYLAENYRQRQDDKQICDKLNLTSEKHVLTVKKEEPRYDWDLGIKLDDKINLEMQNYLGTNGDTKLFYLLYQSSNSFEFYYKNCKFVFNVIDVKDLDSRIILSHGEFSVFSRYSITFDPKDKDVFETFIKTSITYWNKYYNNDKEDLEKISIYLTGQEGYFEYLGKRHKRDIDSIYLPKKQKEEIIADITRFIKPETRDRYIKLGINHKRVYLLEGVPGTGKTSLITAIASKFNFNISIISFVPKMTDIELLRALRSINDDRDQDVYEKKNKQSIIIFEDIDCIFKERKSKDDSKNGITFSGLLNALDGITSNENMICFITTNYKHNLDSALLRPGRIDYIMRFDYSTKEQIQDMFRDFTSCTDASKIDKFYKQCSELRIKITTALLQQYLMTYIDKPMTQSATLKK